ALVAGGHLTFNWFGVRYGLGREQPLSVLERLLVETIAVVLRERATLFAWTGPHPPQPDRDLPARAHHHARTHGWLEDRCVATFLAAGLVSDAPAADRRHIDTLSAAIEVARRAAATTHENRRITTGVLVAVSGSPARSRMFERRAVRYE